MDAMQLRVRSRGMNELVDQELRRRQLVDTAKTFSSAI
jgi:hypothetical protein